LLDENIAKGEASLTRAVYVEVIGHTDDVGDAKANQKLSEERARTVRGKLVKARVHPNEIVAVGLGSSQPIASNQTEEGREQNRRVEVMVLGRLRQ
nr:OmpA family protein [Gammaproteobacteria bacterium]